MVKALCLAVFLFATSVFAAETPPDILVREVVDEVVDSLKVPGVTEQKLHEIVDTKVLPHFDIEKMTRLALGDHWREATLQQRQILVREFGALLGNAFASVLSEYHGQKVKIFPPAPNETTVRTEIVSPGELPTRIDFRMEMTDKGWEAYDVVIDHLSLLRVYRMTFEVEILEKGIDGLIIALQRKKNSVTP